MYEQERAVAVGHDVAGEEPHNRVHVGAECACWRAICRRQVPAEGHSGTVAWRCGSKGELVLPSISTPIAGLKATVFLVPLKATKQKRPKPRDRPGRPSIPQCRGSRG